MNSTGMDRTWGLLAALAIGLVLFAVLFAFLAHAEIPGQVINGTAIYRDADGVAALPDSARLFVFRDGSLLASNRTYPDGGISAVGSVLTWAYLLPSTSPDSARFTFVMRASKAADAISNDYFECSPASFEPSPEMANNTIHSFLTRTASSTFAAVSESTFVNGISGTMLGTITKSGAPVTGAFVLATTSSNRTVWTGYAPSLLGNFDMLVPHVSGVSETIYVSAWYQNSWVLTPTAVVLP